MLDLSIEAAVALDHLRVFTARRLALDALNIAQSTPKEAAGLATVPACVAAQVLYEEACVDQAVQRDNQDGYRDTACRHNCSL